MSDMTRELFDELGDNMKRQEARFRAVLPNRCFMVIRLDGRSFSKYTKPLPRPFDPDLAADMAATAAALAQQVPNTVAVYTQSDEISLVCTDLTGERTQWWVGGVVPKICSLTASIATVEFANARRVHGDSRTAHFDSRCFVLPDKDTVVDYLRWRHHDCERNSVHSAARSQFSAKQLHGVSVASAKRMLAEAGFPWEEMSELFRYGQLIRKHVETGEVTWTHKRSGETRTEVVQRSVWRSEAAGDIDQFVSAVNGVLAEIPDPVAHPVP